MKAVAVLLITLTACELPVNGTGPDLPPIPVATAPAPDDTATVKPKADAGATPHVDASSSIETTPEASCHSTAPGYYQDYPASWCANTIDPQLLEGIASSRTLAIIGRDPNGVCVPLAETCNTCDYTCDCVLKDRCAPGAKCICEQAIAGGIILFGPIPTQ